MHGRSAVLCGCSGEQREHQARCWHAWLVGSGAGTCGMRTRLARCPPAAGARGSVGHTNSAASQPDNCYSPRSCCRCIGGIAPWCRCCPHPAASRAWGRLHSTRVWGDGRQHWVTPPHHLLDTLIAPRCNISGDQAAGACSRSTQQRRCGWLRPPSAHSAAAAAAARRPQAALLPPPHPSHARTAERLAEAQVDARGSVVPVYLIRCDEIGRPLGLWCGLGAHCRRRRQGQA